MGGKAREACITALLGSFSAFASASESESEFEFEFEFEFEDFQQIEPAAQVHKP